MNINEEKFQIYAALQGFDIVGFDKWLPTLKGKDKGKGAYDELVERRSEAMDSMKDEQRFLRHLEWMLLRWRWITRADALAPWAALGQKSKRDRSNAAALRHQNHAEKVAGLVEALDAAALLCRDECLLPSGRWGFGALGKIEKKAKSIWLGKCLNLTDFTEKINASMIRTAMNRIKNTT